MTTTPTESPEQLARRQIDEMFDAGPGPRAAPKWDRATNMNFQMLGVV